VRVHLTGFWLIAAFAATSVIGKQCSAGREPSFMFSAAERLTTLAHSSVLDDIVGLQRDQGLTIAWYEDGLYATSFNRRSVIRSVRPSFLTPAMSGAVSLDGTQIAGYHRDASNRLTLGIVRYDGSDAREYQGIAPVDFCWSHDNQSIALTNSQGHRTASMEVLNVVTKATRLIQADVEERWHFSSQCWSPDDKQLVFENGGTTQVYDIESTKIRDIVKGVDPTWSPDGEWIAFREHDTYYAIRPSGVGRRELFRKKDVTSGLYWSPDSRIVAYVSQAGILEGGVLLDVETYRLRVRRLQDNSEDWVANGVSCCINYQWIKNVELLK
jgi:WD40 repeat protein